MYVVGASQLEIFKRPPFIVFPSNRKIVHIPYCTIFFILKTLKLHTPEVSLCQFQVEADLKCELSLVITFEINPEEHSTCT